MPKRRRALPRRRARPLFPQTRAKTKGVADIVFVVDVSGSMSPCIDALRKNIEAFINSLSQGGPNNAAPVRDWRGKVVGYRDIEAAQSEGLPWIVDNPFVTDAGALKAQLTALEAAMAAATSRNRCLIRCTKLRPWKRCRKVRRAWILESGATAAMRPGS